MKRIVRAILAAAVTAATLILLTPTADAVPSYTRRYGLECSSCHTMWGSLNAAGVTFRLSGYRAMFGRDLVPISPDIDVGAGVFAIPTTLPLSFITGFGGDWRTEKRQPSDGTILRRTASSLNVEDASIFLTGPIGKHFSVFAEFPMFESKAWEFTPTGPSEANDHTQVRQFQFTSESPAFEVAKFWFNNLLGEALLPRDSFNALVGITHIPLAYPSGKVRLSVNQYLVYERRALDLISPLMPGSFLVGDSNDKLFRLSEPQALAEINGMIVPGGSPTDTSKRETFWLEYHLGMSNGSAVLADNNNAKDAYGRLVGRYYGQSLGVFGYFSPDTYDDTLRRGAALNPASLSLGRRRIPVPTGLPIRPFWGSFNGRCPKWDHESREPVRQEQCGEAGGGRHPQLGAFQYPVRPRKPVHVEPREQSHAVRRELHLDRRLPSAQLVHRQGGRGLRSVRLDPGQGIQ